MRPPIKFIECQPVNGSFKRNTRRRVVAKKRKMKATTRRPARTRQADATTSLRFHFHRPRNPAPFANLETNFLGPPTYYSYQDLGDDGGFNVRISGPAQDVERAVRTIYEMKEIPEEPSIQEIMDTVWVFSTSIVSLGPRSVPISLSFRPMLKFSS
ncbi:hypothetical protein BJV82DRAFT_675325 [Fennellomyces sp. T-0311]|nr:hypothetical protein BJV82DRAFT_675325 [Fennellomyces sp. T-0311]